MDRITSRGIGTRVLLVESHPANTAVMSSVLAQNGCRVRIASSANDAAVMTTLEPFDFVVINRDIPHGRALSRRLTSTGRMREQDVFPYSMHPADAE